MSGKVGFVSLGCPKALVDSERIITQLRSEGYQTANDYDNADLVVVNTCGFIDEAKAESLQAIGEAINENGRVIVTGCLGEDAELIQQTHPQVLAVTGAHATEAVVAEVHRALPREVTHDPHIDLLPPQGSKLTPPHYAYLKIAEGCNHKCSFCIIPSMRGKLVSRPANEVLEEAQRLVDNGVQELLVISQDTSAYGADRKYRTEFWNGRPVKSRLTELCDAMGELGAWVRLHYIYPYPHVDELMPLMAQGKVIPYLDVPFQHGSPATLKRMRRPGSIDNTLEQIARWRQQVPDLTLRSTFIVGFPGETEAEFQQLLEFIKIAQIDRAGCFKYSAVEGAAANALDGAVDEAVKQERFERFMEVQTAVSAAKLQAKVGSVQQVIIDEVVSEGAVGRTLGDAPEIDGQVFLDLEENVEPGDRVKVVIEEADEHDLWGYLVD
ncbi:MAG: 30S ribosomal protein S12 methylthiotransferase RimO [Gammaproteobacteria bacterium]